MTKDLAEWAAIGELLLSSNPEKFHEVLECAATIAEAQAIIAGYDHQLILRDRRPTKRYAA